MLGACSRVETARTTHLNNQKNFKEATTELDANLKNLYESQEDIVNHQKLYNRFAGGFKEGKNADGTAKMETTKRSAFESESFRKGGKEFMNKNFQTKGFDTKSFAGSGKKFDTSSWKKGDSLADIKLDTPEFARRQSGIRSEQSEYGEKKYATGKGNADESGKNWAPQNEVKPPEHLMNQDAIEKRTRIARPDIMSKEEAQLKSIQEIRAIMGRND